MLKGIPIALGMYSNMAVGIENTIPVMLAIIFNEGLSRKRTEEGITFKMEGINLEI
jgi:hypothetical protein